MDVVKLPKKARMVCYEIMDGKEGALDTLESFSDKYPHQVAAVKAEVAYFNLDYEKALALDLTILPWLEEWYDMDERSYKIIAVRKGTILIDERLCETRSIGRLRFTCAHELAHWVLHKNLYSGTGNIAAYNGQCSTDESDGVIERQADALATALLMPLPQIKKCFYRLRSGRTMEQIVAEMAQIFEVSKQAMQIRLQSHNLM